MSDPGVRARISAAAKARWADPEQRAFWCAALKAAMNRPDVLQRRAEGRAARKAAALKAAAESGT